MRASRLAFASAFLFVAPLLLSGCSGRRIVAVDPFPCGDAGASGCTGLLDDLVGFWRLNEASGSAAALDWSARGNDGMLEGIDPGSAWVAGGPDGRALAPQGKGYVVVPPSTSIDSITMRVTMAAWIYIDGSITDFATAISRQIGTSYGQLYHLSIRSDLTPAMFITTPASTQVFISGPTPVPQQTWVHIAGTYDGARGRLYLNGVEVASAAVTGPFATETNPVILSGNGNASGPDYTERIPGRLADVMLFRRALSAQEIVQLKNVDWGGVRRDASTGQ